MGLLSFPVVDQGMSQGLEVAKLIQVEPFRHIMQTACLVGHLCESLALRNHRLSLEGPLLCHDWSAKKGVCCV
jgi:hypothetical protein